MFAPTEQEIRSVMKSKGYKFFDKKVKDNSDDFNLNIIGIRLSDVATNKFDDTLCLFYKENNEMQQFYCQCTTDPGWYYLEDKLGNPSGTAIIAPGQHLGCWSIGRHKGQYPALVQTGPITIFRDATKDKTLDKVKKQTVQGCGLNLHRANPKGTSVDVNNWSAGCQVVAGVKNFEHIMVLANVAAKKYGNKFTYTLLERKDFM